MSQRLDGNGQRDHEAAGCGGMSACGTMKASHRNLACLGEEIMAKMMTSVMVVMTVGVMNVTTQSLAAEPLLEIYINDEGDVSDVRDETGSLKPAPVQNIAVGDDRLRLISSQSLILAEIVSEVDGTTAFCVPKGGGNCNLGDGVLYSIDQAGEIASVKNRVGDKWVEAAEELHMHGPSEIQSLKSHAIAVFEDQQGNRYGMVISGMVISPDHAGDTQLSMWFNPDQFKATDE
jgi:hypothetical protein